MNSFPHPKDRLNISPRWDTANPAIYPPNSAAATIFLIAGRAVVLRHDRLWHDPALSRTGSKHRTTWVLHSGLGISMNTLTRCQQESVAMETDGTVAPCRLVGSIVCVVPAREADLLWTLCAIKSRCLAFPSASNIPASHSGNLSACSCSAGRAVGQSFER